MRIEFEYKKKGGYNGMPAYIGLLKLYKEDGLLYEGSFSITENEHRRFLREKTFPLTTDYGSKIWLDKNCFLHNMSGPSRIWYDNGQEQYHIHGKEYKDNNKWKQAVKDRITIFSAQKIKTLKNS